MSITGLDGRELHQAGPRAPAPTSGSRSAGSRTSSCSTGPTPTWAGTRSSTCSKDRSTTLWAPSRLSLARISTGWTCVPRCRTIQRVGSSTSQTTVWESGCTSWYTTDSGRNTNNWPDYTFMYRYRIRRFDLSSYRVMPRAARRRGREMSRLSGLGLPPSLMRLGAGQIGRHVLNRDLPWPTQRQRLDRLMGASPIPRGTHVTELTISGVRTETVTVIGERPKRTVLHFHGGGYCVGSAKMAQGWAARLAAQAACQVVVPEYRLAPEHPFPAALDDARDLLRALPGDVDPASVVLSGDSAGAGLAMSLLLALREAGEQLPAGAILISPWLDLTADRRANADLVRRDVLLSPRWLEAAPALTPTRRTGRIRPSHRCSANTTDRRCCSSSLPPMTCSRPTRSDWPSAPRPPRSTSPTPPGRACGTTSPCSPACWPPPTARSLRRRGSSARSPVPVKPPAGSGTPPR